MKNGLGKNTSRKIEPKKVVFKHSPNRNKESNLGSPGRRNNLSLFDNTPRGLVEINTPNDLI